MRRSTFLLSVTVGFGLLYLAAVVALGSTPGAGEDGPAVADWFRSHGGQVRAWMLLLTLFAPLFATFAALVRAQLPAPHRDLFFFGAIAFAAETAVQGWLWAGMAWHASQLQPATARTLLDVASFWGPVLTSTTVIMLAPIVVLALRGGAGLPRWLGLRGGVAGAPVGAGDGAAARRGGPARRRARAAPPRGRGGPKGRGPGGPGGRRPTAGFAESRDPHKPPGGARDVFPAGGGPPA